MTTSTRSSDDRFTQDSPPVPRNLKKELMTQSQVYSFRTTLLWTLPCMVLTFVYHVNWLQIAMASHLLRWAFLDALILLFSPSSTFSLFTSTGDPLDIILWDWRGRYHRLVSAAFNLSFHNIRNELTLGVSAQNLHLEFWRRVLPEIFSSRWAVAW